MLVIAFAFILRFIENDCERAGYSFGLFVFGVFAFVTIMISSPANEADIEEKRQDGLVRIEAIKAGLITCYYKSLDNQSRAMITTRDHCSYLLELYALAQGRIGSIKQYRENKTGGEDELVTKYNK